MAKFYGKIGFIETRETKPGVWDEYVVERLYCGDLERNSRRYDRSEQLNDNLNISNSVSIVADPYAMNNFHSLRYVTFMGSKWKVSDVEVRYPRLVLTFGGLYNEGQADSSVDTGDSAGE
jgi:hypothetical protein